MDPGSSLGYVNEKTAKSVHLSIRPSTHNVSMSVGSLQESVLGRCVAELTLNGIRYQNVSLGVTKNLCSDVLLGQRFQRQHEGVVLVYDGTKPELVVSQRREACVVAAATTVECPSLFNCLTSNWRPVCATSRRYSAADTAYIECEVKKLFAEGIIRESKSLWRAQPLVAMKTSTTTYSI